LIFVFPLMLIHNAIIALHRFFSFFLFFVTTLLSVRLSA